MTKEQILEKNINCTCDKAYKIREMADPDCGRCTWYEEIAISMELYAQQEVAKERERYDELKARYDALVMDNMALEYNAAEAEKHLPDLIKQFVDQERERTAKMVEALRIIAEKVGHTWVREDILKLIKEYNENTLNR